MDSPGNIEPVGRSLRAGVMLASLGICLLLFWGLKNIFAPSAPEKSDTAPVRGSSFSAVKRTPPVQQIKPADTNSAASLKETATTAIDGTPVPPAPSASPPVAPLAPAVQPDSAPPRLVPTLGVSHNAITGSAIIHGKITLNGIPEPEKKLPLDPICGKLHAAGSPTTQFYVVGPDGGLADVFVYISRGMENRRYPPPTEPMVLDQVGCIYTPYVSGALLGQVIEVWNSDPILHNVHPTPKTNGNREYNKAHLPKTQPLRFQWDQEELFLRFKCDVHPWMFAYVSLLPHPYFAVTDKNGDFSIPNLPVGTYHLKLLHRKTESVTLEVVVNDNAQIEMRESLKIVR